MRRSRFVTYYVTLCPRRSLPVLRRLVRSSPSQIPPGERCSLAKIRERKRVTPDCVTKLSLHRPRSPTWRFHTSRIEVGTRNSGERGRLARAIRSARGVTPTQLLHKTLARLPNAREETPRPARGTRALPRIEPPAGAQGARSVRAGGSYTRSTSSLGFV